MNVLFSSLRGASGADAPRIFSDPETKWVRAAQRGDTRAFNQLIVRHQERAYRIAYHLLQDAHAAANITQSVITYAQHAIYELDNEAFGTWLLRLLMQRCAAFLQLYPAPAPAHSTVESALATLPLPERVMLVLADMERLATRDIAQILQTDAATVRAQIHRARCALRDVLTPAYA